MKPTTLHLHTKHQIAPVAERVFRGFMEHMARCIYEGVYHPACAHALRRLLHAPRPASAQHRRLTRWQPPSAIGKALSRLLSYHARPFRAMMWENDWIPASGCVQGDQPMLPLQYIETVQRAQRADLLADAERDRLARASMAGRTARPLRESTMRVLCRLPLPALEPACALVPAR